MRNVQLFWIRTYNNYFGLDQIGKVVQEPDQIMIMSCNQNNNYGYKFTSCLNFQVCLKIQLWVGQRH